MADDKDDVFAEGLTTCAGMPVLIGVVVADSETEALATASVARRAASLVRVEYEDLPAILSIDEALTATPPSLHRWTIRMRTAHVLSCAAIARVCE